MALVLGIVGIANGDFTNQGFEDGLTGLSVESTRRGDLEIYDRDLAIKLGKGKAKLGISAKIFGDLNDDSEFTISRFNNFSIVYDPACKDAFINLQEGGIVTSDTSKGSEVGGSYVNREVDYGEKEKKKKKLNTVKKEENNRENMEKEEVIKAELNQSEELNSKLDSIIDSVLKLSERMDVLEKSEEEVVEEKKEVTEEKSKEEAPAEEKSEEEAPAKEEPKEELEEKPKEESAPAEEAKEEVKEEPKEEEKDSEKEELSSKLDEAKAEIALLKAEKSTTKPKTYIELSKQELGPGSRDFSNMEMGLLNALNKQVKNE